MAILFAALALPPGIACSSSSSGGSAGPSGPHDSGAPTDPSTMDSTVDSGADSNAATDSASSTDSPSATDAGHDADATLGDADAGPEAGPAEGGSTVTSYLGTQSPGDVWSWTLDHGAGAFSAKDITTGYTYSGAIAQVTGTGIVGGGFTKLSIVSTTDPSAATWNKQEAFAVEFPGTALLVSPPGPVLGGNSNGYVSKLIVASALGGCPTSTGTYNTVVIPRSTWEGQTMTLASGQDVVGPAYGTATLALTDAGFTLSGTATQVTITDTDLAGDYTIAEAGAALIPASTFGCDGGQLTSAGTTTVGVTPSGVLIEDLGGADPNIAGVIGVQQTAVPSVMAMQGDYLGFVFAWTNATAGYTIAVSCAPSDAGAFELCQPYDSLDPVTPSQFGTGANVTIPVFFDSTSSATGMLTGHVIEGQPPRPTSQNVFMATEVGGKGLLVGITGSGSAPALQNLMLIQQ